MRSAYLYLDATYESPGVAASAFGVERQHVNYCSLLTARGALLAARCSLLTAHCSLLANHCPLPTAHCSLLAACCSLLTSHCSLLTAHCSPNYGQLWPTTTNYDQLWPTMTYYNQLWSTMVNDGQLQPTPPPTPSGAVQITNIVSEVVIGNVYAITALVSSLMLLTCPQDLARQPLVGDTPCA